MKPKHEFDPNCNDCKPCLTDPLSGQILPDEHPYTVANTEVVRRADAGDQVRLGSRRTAELQGARRPSVDAGVHGEDESGA